MKWARLVLFLSLYTLAADSANLVPYSIDFSGGLNVRSNKNAVGDTQCYVSDNLLYDEGRGFITRKGLEALDSFPVIGKSPTKGWEYINPNGTSYIVIQTEDSLDYSVDGGVSWYNIRTGLKWQQNELVATTFYGLIFFSNGVDHVFSFDGQLYIEHSFIPKGTVLTTHLNKMFIGNTPDFPSNIYYILDGADPTLQESWPASQFVEAGVLDGDEIIWILSFGGTNLIIFKKYSTWMLSGYSITLGWEPQEIIPNLGCVSPGSIQYHNGMIIFLSHEGLYGYNGSLIDIDKDTETAFLDSNNLAYGYRYWRHTATNDWNLGTSTGSSSDLQEIKHEQYSYTWDERVHFDSGTYTNSRAEGETGEFSMLVSSYVSAGATGSLLTEGYITDVTLDMQGYNDNGTVNTFEQYDLFSTWYNASDTDSLDRLTTSADFKPAKYNNSMAIGGKAGHLETKYPAGDTVKSTKYTIDIELGAEYNVTQLNYKYLTRVKKMFKEIILELKVLKDLGKDSGEYETETTDLSNTLPVYLSCYTFVYARNTTAPYNIGQWRQIHGKHSAQNTYTYDMDGAPSVRTRHNLIDNTVTLDRPETTNAIRFEIIFTPEIDVATYLATRESLISGNRFNILHTRFIHKYEACIDKLYNLSVNTDSTATSTEFETASLYKSTSVRFGDGTYNVQWGSATFNADCDYDLYGTSITFGVGTSTDGIYWPNLQTFKAIGAPPYKAKIDLAEGKYAFWQATMTSVYSTYTALMLDAKIEALASTYTWVSEPYNRAQIATAKYMVMDDYPYGQDITYSYHVASSTTALTTAAYKDITSGDLTVGTSLWIQKRIISNTTDGTKNPTVYSYNHSWAPVAEAINTPSFSYQNRYGIALSSSGTTSNKQVYVYDRNGVWTRFLWTPSDFFRYGLYWYMCDNSTSTISKILSGEDDNGTPIKSEYRKRIDFQGPNYDKELKMIYTKGIEKTGGKLHLRHQIENNDTLYTKTIDINGDGTFTHRSGIPEHSAVKHFDVVYHSTATRIQVLESTLYAAPKPLK